MTALLDTLDRLRREATFDLPVKWTKTNGDPVDMAPDEDGYVYIPELASLGDTGIAFISDYEDRANDAALIAAALNNLDALVAVARAAEAFINARADDNESFIRLRESLSRLSPAVREEPK